MLKATADIDKIHGRLQEISAELLRDIKSANIKLADILMPLSMAVITVFDESFMGIGENASEKESS